MIASVEDGSIGTFLKELDHDHIDALDRYWPFWARADQLPPDDRDWRVWLILGGRGAGKTRAGAEWVRAMATGCGSTQGAFARRIALVGTTKADTREVMIDGPSGIVACHGAGGPPRFEAGRRRLIWPNGALAQMFSADEPKQLRGPQFDAAWADEIAKWRDPDEAFDMLAMAVRLGKDPRIVVTTTPRPIPLLKRLIADEGTVISRAPTRRNRLFLADGFVDAMQARYGGTRLGRQELDGDLIDERPGALWTRAGLDTVRVREMPQLVRIVVAVDPPAAATSSSACGLVVAGLGTDRRFYVLEDATLEAASPARWAARAVDLFHKYGADRIVAEINQGGDMVLAVLREAEAGIPVATVRATRGKFLRAEPVAALYEQGRVSHVGAFVALEDQMCDFTHEGLGNGRSPDRLDALVWAITALSEPVGQPKIRVV